MFNNSFRQVSKELDDYHDGAGDDIDWKFIEKWGYPEHKEIKEKTSRNYLGYAAAWIILATQLAAAETIKPKQKRMVQKVETERVEVDKPQWSPLDIDPIKWEVLTDGWVAKLTLAQSKLSWVLNISWPHAQNIPIAAPTEEQLINYAKGIILCLDTAFVAKSHQWYVYDLIAVQDKLKEIYLSFNKWELTSKEDKTKQRAVLVMIQVVHVQILVHSKMIEDDMEQNTPKASK